MGRISLVLRDAVPSDVEALREIWADLLRRTTPAEQALDLLAVLEAADRRADERVLVAEVDGEVAGAVHLRVSTLSPINLEPVVQAIAPHVRPGHRRRGVGVALMEAAVAFAEERQVTLVGSAASSSSRDSNRFFARLAMGPRATLRVASTHTVRQRLAAMRPGPAGRPSSRQLDKVLAARRVRRAERVS